jgi:hypothetical protein
MGRLQSRGVNSLCRPALQLRKKDEFAVTEFKTSVAFTPTTSANTREQSNGC